MNKDAQLIAEAYQSIYNDQVNESVRGALAGAVMGLMSLFGGQHAQGQVQQSSTTSEVNPQQQIDNNTSAGLQLLKQYADAADQYKAKFDQDYASLSKDVTAGDNKSYMEKDRARQQAQTNYYNSLRQGRQELMKQFNLDDNQFERLIGYATNYDPNTYKSLMKFSLATQPGRDNLNKWADTSIHNSKEDLSNTIKQINNTVRGIQSTR